MEKNSNIKKWSIFITALFLSTVILTPISQSLTINNRKNGEQQKINVLTSGDFSIAIHRIRQEDEIDPWPYDEADWRLMMYVNDMKKTFDCEGDDIIIDQTFTWPDIIQLEDDYVYVKMELMERDDWPGVNDIADISAHPGGGVDDSNQFPRGAVFKRTFNLNTYEWEPVDEDNDYLKIEYTPQFTWFVTSGNYDGSTTIDENDATIWFNISIGNTPPYPPEKPKGPTIGWIDTIYEYSTKSYDIDGDEIQFGWDWEGDGDVDEVTGFYGAWEEATIPHSWSKGGLYYVKAISIDTNGALGGWSDPLKVRMNAPGGINGVEVEEWSLGHVYSFYYNHEKTQEIIQILRGSGNVITALSIVIAAIAAACGVPIDISAITAVATALVRLSVEVISMMDRGMGIYIRTYVIEVNGFPVAFFAYIWSQTATGSEGKAPEGNEAPEKPEKPSGRRRIIPGRQYAFSTVATDPDGDNITYIFDWGDDEFSCSDLKKSGTRVIMKHTWKEKGDYCIRAKVVDEYGQESEWSDIHKVTVPRTKHTQRSTLLDVLERMLNYLKCLKLVII